MTHEYRAFVDARTQIAGSASAGLCSTLLKAAAVRRTIPTLLFVILLFGAGTTPAAFADGLSRATAAYSRGDYVLAAKRIIPAGATRKRSGADVAGLHVRKRLRCAAGLRRRHRSLPESSRAGRSLCTEQIGFEL